MDYMNLISIKLVFYAAILLVLLGYWVFNFTILYHLARFGIGTQPKKIAAIFFLGLICLFFASTVLFAGLDLNSLKDQLSGLLKLFFNTTYSL
ncbi:MAG: hypothetical protein AAB837_00600 [Patescibacteria group bacterium]